MIYIIKNVIYDVEMTSKLCGPIFLKYMLIPKLISLLTSLVFVRQQR